MNASGKCRKRMEMGEKILPPFLAFLYLFLYDEEEQKDYFI